MLPSVNRLGSSVDAPPQPAPRADRPPSAADRAVRAVAPGRDQAACVLSVPIPHRGPPRRHRPAGPGPSRPPAPGRPTPTSSGVPAGRNRSIRDPNFITPNRSPARTASPGRTRQTTRRTRTPVICRNTTRARRGVDPDLVPLVLGRRLGPVGRPGSSPACSRPASRVPLTGIRLTCTSRGDRKMLIWLPLARRARRRSAARRRPSRGRRPATPPGRCSPGPPGPGRGRRARGRRPAGRTATPRSTSRTHARPSAGTSAPATNGNPARSICHRTPATADPARSKTSRAGNRAGSRLRNAVVDAAA